MPLSDIDLLAQGLTIAWPGRGAAPGPPPLGAPDAVVMCHWCGFTVRAHAPDRCRCGRVAVQYEAGKPVLRDPEGSTADIIFRLVRAPAV